MVAASRPIIPGERYPASAFRKVAGGTEIEAGPIKVKLKDYDPKEDALLNCFRCGHHFRLHKGGLIRKCPMTEAKNRRDRSCEIRAVIIESI